MMAKHAGYYGQWQQPDPPEPKEPIYVIVNQVQITINVTPALMGLRVEAGRPAEPPVERIPKQPRWLDGVPPPDDRDYRQ